jgi:phosphoribosylanthranilate isomerase
MMNNGKKIEIKICGMRDPDNILEVALLAPHYFGFIFYPDSPRFVGNNFTIPISLPSSIKRVGVFVDESNDNIISRAKEVGFDFVQLHGSESIEQCQELRASGLNVIKVFSIDNNFKFEETRLYKKAVDYFLFDTKGKFYGGNAQTFNWELLVKYDQEIPFFLSGGLTPENVRNIPKIKDLNLHALDLNSGVEISPGIKSKERVETVMKEIRGTKDEVRGSTY